MRALLATTRDRFLLALQYIKNAGMEPVAFGQGYGSMSAPSSKMEELILAGTLEHGANPVLTWMADNVVITESPSGAIKPDKSKSKKKIDGIVASIMGIGRSFALETPAESIYKRRKGIIKL